MEILMIKEFGNLDELIMFKNVIDTYFTNNICSGWVRQQ
jgi:hypothetical protein